MPARHQLHPRGWHPCQVLQQLLHLRDRKALPIHGHEQARRPLRAAILLHHEENTPGSGYNATLGVLLTVKEMAEKYGKYFAVEYDMGGLPPDFDPNRYFPALTNDYNNVLKPLFESPNYIYQDGRPVLQIWGVGINATAFPGNKFHDLIDRYHSTPENPWIILGVPQTWMEFSNTTNDPTGFYEAYQAAEALQPWPVGAWNDVDSLRGALNQYILPGKAQLDAWGVKYMGAYHPGTGNRNAARRPGEPSGPLDDRYVVLDPPLNG